MKFEDNLGEIKLGETLFEKWVNISNNLSQEDACQEDTLTSHNYKNFADCFY